jgi:acyl-CoA dehydrogenase
VAALARRSGACGDGGFDADRVGWAFCGGYQAALRVLQPTLPAETIAALCVTEESGNRPRDIRTRLEPHADGGFVLHGAKRWTTLGPDSALLLVVAVVPSETDRPLLKAVQLPTGTPGLQRVPMPETRFVPEVPHARVLLDAVRVPESALLPGDGYDAYVKPFRSIEDIHVTLAVLAYLLRETRRRGWPTEVAERTCAAMLALCALSGASPDSAAVHVALAGALALARAIHDEAGALFAAGSQDAAALRWQRDAALFEVASSARMQRGVRAWERLRAAR